MSTSIEVPDLAQLFELVSRIRQAQLDEGAERIIIELKVDERRDKQATLQSKIDSVSSLEVWSNTITGTQKIHDG